MRRDYELARKRRARAFEGFEVWWHARQMEFKMLLYLTVAFAVLFWVLWWGIWYLRLKPLEKANLFVWLEAETARWFWPTREMPVRTASGVFYSPAYEAAEALRPHYLGRAAAAARAGALLFVPAWLGTLALFARIFRRKAAEEVHGVEVSRGPRLIEPDELERLSRKTFGSGRFAITEHIILPSTLENRHAFVIGTTGSGKSTLMRRLLLQLRKEKARVVVFDLKGEFLAQFYDPDRDAVFNPLDERCVRWSVLNDLTHDEAFDFARSFIPEAESGSGAEAYFNDAARDVLAAILRTALARGGMGNDKLAGVVFSGLVRIVDFLSSHPAGSVGKAHLVKLDSAQAAGIMSTLMRYARVFEYLPGLDGDFSFRRWIREEGEGFLFLPVPPRFRSLLAPLFAAVVDLLFLELLSLPDDVRRRRWFIIDELGALGKLNRLVDALTLARSKGGCVWVGIQDFGRVDQLYGRALRETLWNNTALKVVLRVDAPDTADYLSRSIGEPEVEIPDENVAMGVEDYRDGLSFSRRDTLKRLVLPSEIQALPDLTCIAKLGGLPPAMDRVVFTPAERNHPDFVRRENIPRPEPEAPESGKPGEESSGNEPGDREMDLY